ncbi:MAG: hypothetical protein HN837_06460, partial [Chloroflexi bacterium]|nr:hypothetical protein [Chloroflexota bacterium]
MGQYYLFKTLEMTLGFLPKRLCYFLASVMGAVAFRVVPSLRRTVTKNISQVLGPQASNSKLNKTVRGVLSSTFKNYLDLVRIPRLSRKKIIKMVDVTGRHHLDKAVAKGKGVIMFTAHLGSFDTAFQRFSTFPTQVTVVV